MEKFEAQEQTAVDQGIEKACEQYPDRKEVVLAFGSLIKALERPLPEGAEMDELASYYE